MSFLFVFAQGSRPLIHQGRYCQSVGTQGNEFEPVGDDLLKPLGVGKQNPRGFAVLTTGRDYLVKGSTEIRIIEPAWSFHVDPQIHRPYKQDIDSLNGSDLPGLFNGLSRFNLNHGEEILVGIGKVFLEASAKTTRPIETGHTTDPLGGYRMEATACLASSALLIYGTMMPEGPRSRTRLKRGTSFQAILTIGAAGVLSAAWS